jgi:hypothetical protein
LADGTETVVALDTPGAYSSYRLIAQSVGVGEDAAKIAGIRTWADGLPLLDYAHPITLVNGHVMTRVGTTAMVIDPSSNAATTIAVSLTPTAKPALLPDGSVFWPPAVGYTIGYRVATDGTVTTVTGIASDVSNAVLQADGTVLMLPSSGTTAQTYDPSSGAVANVTAYSLPGSDAILEPAAVPGGVLALPNKAASGSLVKNGTVTTTTALFGANYNESKVVASDAEVDAQFGSSVAVSGDGTRMVVGAYLEDVDGLADAGAAYVYVMIDGVWTLQAKITASNKEASDSFGNAVSISSDGTHVIIGAFTKSDGKTNSGAAYIYTFENEEWIQKAYLRLGVNQIQTNSRFGSSVAMSGDGQHVIVGCPYFDSTEDSAGRAYIYSLVNGVWGSQVELGQSIVQIRNGRFGYSLAMNTDGTSVIVGSENYHTYMFSLIDGVWEDVKIFYRNGSSVSMNTAGDRAVIGLVTDDAGGADSGAAFVYSRVDGVWVEEKLIPSDSEASAKFGWSTSMSSGGDRMVIGSHLKDENGLTNTGASYIFSRVNGVWIEAKIVPSDSEGNAQFGQNVSISGSGDRVVIGAFLDDATGLADAGAAYVYDLSSAGQIIASGNALVAKGSTVKSYDINGDAVTSIIDMPATIGDLTILDDGRVLATSAHDTAMTYDPVSGNITSVQGPRSLGRATRLLDGKVWTEGGLVFQSGSSVSTPLTATIGLSSFVNP